MVQKDVFFKDGTRIFYEETDGTPQRYIEYAFTPQEIRDMKEKPFLKSYIENRVRKHNAGKYYYLGVLAGIVRGFDIKQRDHLYMKLKELHDKTSAQFDRTIFTEDYKKEFGRYWKGNEIQCYAFFTTIYLAMVDWEELKQNFKSSMGKTMVLKSCEAVIYGWKDPRDAAIMFERKNINVHEEDFTDNKDLHFEKYNGYNGFDDDTIDEGFDGFPEATWNVD